MRNRKTFRFIAMTLALAAAFVFATPAGAALYKKTIEVFTGVNIYVDGVELIPTDANGNQVEVFAYNGTTYIPLRAVSQALGKAVTYDGSTQTAYVGKVPGQDMLLKDVCPPYQSSGFELRESVVLGGKQYANAYALASNAPNALFNLNGQFSTLEFDIGHIDGSYEKESTINIYLDGELAFTKNLNSEMLPEHCIVPLNGALQMKITTPETTWSTYWNYAIVNATIE